MTARPARAKRPRSAKQIAATAKMLEARTRAEARAFLERLGIPASSADVTPADVPTLPAATDHAPLTAQETPR